MALSESQEKIVKLVENGFGRISGYPEKIDYYPHDWKIDGDWQKSGGRDIGVGRNTWYNFERDGIINHISISRYESYASYRRGNRFVREIVPKGKMRKLELRFKDPELDIPRVSVMVRFDADAGYSMLLNSLADTVRLAEDLKEGARSSNYNYGAGVVSAIKKNFPLRYKSYDSGVILTDVGAFRGCACSGVYITYPMGVAAAPQRHVLRRIAGSVKETVNEFLKD